MIWYINPNFTSFMFVFCRIISRAHSITIKKIYGLSGSPWRQERSYIIFSEICPLYTNLDYDPTYNTSNDFCVESGKFLLFITAFANSQSTALKASSISRVKNRAQFLFFLNSCSKSYVSRVLSSINLRFINLTDLYL